MGSIFENFLGWLFDKILGLLFYGAIFFVGIPLAVPYINKYLITEIAKEMDRQRKITQIRADKNYRYLMGYDRKRRILQKLQ